MSVSLEQYNALLERVERLEAAVSATSAWDSSFTPATGEFAQPTKPSQAEDRHVTPLLGDYELLVTGARTTDRGAENCVFWNPGPSRGPVPEECYLMIRKASGTNKLVVAKFDPTVKEGTVEAGMFTRLNCELAPGRTSIFHLDDNFQPFVSKELKVKISHLMITGVPPRSPAPVSITEVLNSMRGCYVVEGNTFVVLDSRDGGKVYYRAEVKEGHGRVTDTTSITIAA
jgi:hypothetical protein